MGRAEQTDTTKRKGEAEGLLARSGTVAVSLGGCVYEGVCVLSVAKTRSRTNKDRQSRERERERTTPGQQSTGVAKNGD